MQEIMYYHAPWCQPCETLGPIMDQVNKQIPVRKINIDYADPSVITEAQVRNIPTVVLVENGQEVRRFKFHIIYFMISSYACQVT